MYLALPVLAAAAASTVSTLFMALLLPSVAAAAVKREPPPVWMAVIGIAAASFAWFSSGENPDPFLSVPEEIIWTDKVSASGGLLRGFAEDPSGNRWYVNYRFRSVTERDRFFREGIAGHRFLIRAEREEPDPAAHSYAFDMAKWLRSEGAAGILKLRDAEPAGEAPGMAAALRRWRAALGSHIRAHFPESVAAEAEALVIGERSATAPDDERAYKRLGITHLFAISGLHVGILIYLLREVLLRVGVRTHIVRTGLMLFLPVYAMLAGGAPPVWRAVLISVMLLVPESKSGKRRLDLLLAAGMILFLLVHPQSVSKPGFQMSYLAAFALIHSSAILSTARSGLHQAWLVTVICQVAVTPVLLFHFFETSLSSFVANLLFVPLFSVLILPANLVLLALSFILPQAAGLLFTVYVPLREALARFILVCGELPLSVWTPGRPDLPLLLLLITAVFLFFLLLERRKGLAAGTVLGVVCCIVHAVPYTEPSVRVTFIDVGQGDSALVELPYRRGIILIDTGGRLLFDGTKEEGRGGYGVGERVVVPFLKGRGITKVDKLILSHPDADHAEAADEVLREIRAGEIHIGPGTIGNAGYADVMETAKVKGIPVKERVSGMGWQEGETLFRYLSPADTEYRGNNDSLVLHMEHGELRALFTGDLEEEGEKRVIREYGNLFPVTILKAGHHGSKTSSSAPFLDAASPSITIFSAGRNNRYGHPHPDVTGRLMEAGLPAVSTADYGTMTYSFRIGQSMMITHSRTNGE
ncbi:competence protein ComEC [Bhargavaea beijingensis]|uniref:Competence protein ComEC n=1 Tax=Bhargavaea beijingensis TaxID=426756 RepID=A0A1G7CQN7_9BACL|nr:DNA internalization-related competence protein ComEC/Rec2 [Bhargavaea beijingensis]SDE41080.1 competence protein ComEC [Bhargavaea beijingensis]